MVKRSYTRAFPSAGVLMPYRRPRKISRVSRVRTSTFRPTAPFATRGFKPLFGHSYPERKSADTLQSQSYAVNTTGVIQLMFNPALGSDYTQRIGRKTHIKSIFIRGSMSISAATVLTTQSTPAQVGRMILFIDYQPNGATPAVADVLVPGAPNAYDMLNLDNRDRFKILKDKVFSFDPFRYNIVATTAVAGFNRTIHNFKIYKKCNIETIFNGTNAGTIADINSGALYLLFMGTEAAGATAAVATVSTRCRFLDQ